MRLLAANKTVISEAGERRRHGLSRGAGVLFAAALGALALAGGSAMASSHVPRISIVSLSPGKIKVHFQGQFAIGLVCRNVTGPCTGVVSVYLQGRAAAAAPPAKARLGGGRTTVLTLALTRAARKTLASRHHLNVTIAVQVRDRAHRKAHLTARRRLVGGASVGCWPHVGRGGYKGPSWATGRLFTYLRGSVGTPRTYGCLYSLDHAFALDDPAAGPAYLMVDVPLSGGPPVTVADPFVASLVEGTDTKSGGKLGEPVLYFASWDLRTGRRILSISSWRGAWSFTGLSW